MSIASVILTEHAAANTMIQLYRDSTSAQSKRVIAYLLLEYIASHAKIEETVVFPRIGDVRLIEHLRSEHRDIEGQMLQLLTHGLRANKILGDIESHFADEQKHLIPTLKHHVESEAMAAQWLALRGIKD